MSRSWKQDRTTPKTTVKKAPRPRVSEFARESYQGKGYQVESLVDDTVTCLCGAECKADCDHKAEFCGWPA